MITATANPKEDSCDVLVVGGGPAGSTIAALLAERGHQVVLLEKDRHPRFHIGESLLPFNLPLLDRLGVTEQIAGIGMLKYGIEFVSPWHEKFVAFDFANAWDKDFPFAYQVRRSEFDHALLKNAISKGATVVEGCKVTGVDFRPDNSVRAIAITEQGQETSWKAKFFVDASGRDTLLANHFGIKRRNPKHNSAAMFGHFTGAKRLPGKSEGNISVFWFEYGWFWFIPLRDGATSVGAVCWPHYLKSRKTDLTDFFMETIRTCPVLADRLKDAKLSAPVTATGNYSYRATRMSGPGYIMLGDAFAFIDPVFSTGVYIAMSSAFLGADAVDLFLRDPSRSRTAFRHFEIEIRRVLNSFSWFIYRFTTPTLRELLMGPRNFLRVEEAVLSLLAGDVFRETPIRSRLMFFKSLYYVSFMANLKKSYVSWKKHKDDIRLPINEST